MFYESSINQYNTMEADVILFSKPGKDTQNYGSTSKNGEINGSYHPEKAQRNRRGAAIIPDEQFGFRQAHSTELGCVHHQWIQSEGSKSC